jgi:hypothetical protein
MRSLPKCLVFLVATVLTLLFVAMPILAQPQLTEQSKVFINGIGPIRVGMTVAEAEVSANVTLVEKGGRAGTGGCYSLRSQSGPQNLAFMVISNREDNRMVRNQDRIARVDVYKGNRITTLRGAKVGDTEAQIKSLYPGQITVMPHRYTARQGGHYLTFMPKDAVDRDYRLVFETLGGRVTQFRSGKVPEVEFVEGCA